MTATISDADEHEEPVLVALWVAAWSATMPDIDFDARREWLVTHLASLRDKKSSVLVARDHDAILGFVTVDPAGYVDQLAVSPASRGQGVGRALIQSARERAGCRLSLAVNAANRGAVDFYRRLGFLTYGESTNPRSGLPVLLMREQPGIQR